MSHAPLSMHHGTRKYIYHCVCGSRKLHPVPIYDMWSQYPLFVVVKFFFVHFVARFLPDSVIATVTKPSNGVFLRLRAIFYVTALVVYPDGAYLATSLPRAIPGGTVRFFHSIFFANTPACSSPHHFAHSIL